MSAQLQIFRDAPPDKEYGQSMEQRNSSRIAVKFRSTFSTAHLSDCEAMMRDLSCLGCGIMSLEDLPTGTELLLRIYQPNQEAIIVIESAIVRWSRGGRFGVEFLDLPTKTVRALNKLMDIHT